MVESTNDDISIDQYFPDDNGKLDLDDGFIGLLAQRRKESKKAKPLFGSMDKYLKEHGKQWSRIKVR